MISFTVFEGLLIEVYLIDTSARRSTHLYCAIIERIEYLEEVYLLGVPQCDHAGPGPSPIIEH